MPVVVGTTSAKVKNYSDISSKKFVPFSKIFIVVNCWPKNTHYKCLRKRGRPNIQLPIQLLFVPISRTFVIIVTTIFVRNQGWKRNMKLLDDNKRKMRKNAFMYNGLFFESPYCIVISACMYMLIYLNYIDKQKLMNTMARCREIYMLILTIFSINRANKIKYKKFYISNVILLRCIVFNEL